MNTGKKSFFDNVWHADTGQQAKQTGVDADSLVRDVLRDSIQQRADASERLDHLIKRINGQLPGSFFDHLFGTARDD